jgi:hypothetical protein
MPSRLKEIQKGFVESAFGGITAAFTSSVTGGGKLTPAEAVGVYRDGYPARISEALGETFEACWRVLGDEDFLEACKIYARATPSVSHNLSDYGRSFPAFLKKRFKKTAPFIEDLALLEWSFKEVFHAHSDAVLSPSNLSVAVKDNSVLIFSNAVRLLNLKHSVHAVWKRNRQDSTPLNPSDWEGPQQVLLYRGGGTPVFSSVLAAPEASTLSLLMNGSPLAQALAASKSLSEAAARNLFSFIATSGLITEVR